MRILFYAGSVTGSGHIVRGLALAAALKRAGLPHEYMILSLETPFVELARRFGVVLSVLPLEDEEALGPSGYSGSALFAAMESFKPDILVVDVFWAGLDAFIRDLPCRKVLLSIQMDPSFYNVTTRNNKFVFRPGDYDLRLRTEPGYSTPFDAREINPIVIRNRDEIKSRKDARADFALADDERACLFAFNGVTGEGTEAWKSFSYLQDEGWAVIRSHNREGGLFPAVDWFEAFDLLVCGAGYSAFWETRWFRKDAFYVSFPRIFENQERRPALFSDYEFETNGADELVHLLQEL
jgi:hypothetical protein